MNLKAGDDLVKKRGGGSKRVTVAHVAIGTDSKGGRVRSALLGSVSPSNSRGNNARQWWVPLGDDGLPEGYRRVEAMA